MVCVVPRRPSRATVRCRGRVEVMAGCLSAWSVPGAVGHRARWVPAGDGGRVSCAERGAAVEVPEGAEHRRGSGVVPGERRSPVRGPVKAPPGRGVPAEREPPRVGTAAPLRHAPVGGIHLHRAPLPRAGRGRERAGYARARWRARRGPEGMRGTRGRERPGEREGAVSARWRTRPKDGSARIPYHDRRRRPGRGVPGSGGAYTCRTTVGRAVGAPGSGGGTRAGRHRPAPAGARRPGVAARLSSRRRGSSSRNRRSRSRTCGSSPRASCGTRGPRTPRRSRADRCSTGR